jgi:beta-lactamase superfamily II metal-dependent hydrolase
VTVHLLDPGPQVYGDAILCRFGATTVLIDGAHRANFRRHEGHASIPVQLAELLGSEPPHDISLLIVTHTHEDHIGCLPELVSRDIIRPRWALLSDPDDGWGQLGDAPPNGVDALDELPPTARRLAAAEREERRPDDVPDRLIEELLLDAETLEERYRRMIATLQERETNVVIYGKDDPRPLLEAFADVGLVILGPTFAHLDGCALVIAERMQDAVSDARGRADLLLDASALALYRRWAEALDALDAGRLGAAINNQSIITAFTVGGKRLLFTGDMQLAAPGMRFPDEHRREDGTPITIEQEMRDLRGRIRAAGPYDFVKIAHHGSDNAFDERILADVQGARFFGICTGARSTDHPTPEALQLLDHNRDTLDWARTDRNRRVTLRLSDPDPAFELQAGAVDDPRPNRPVDAPAPAVPVIPAAPAAVIVGPGAGQTPGAGSADVVEVRARIPHVATRVTITVDVEPRSGAPPAASLAVPGDRRLNVGDGQRLRDLLFVTSREALVDNIGAFEAGQALDALRARELPVFDGLPRPARDPRQAAALVRQELARYPDLRGVVLLGGYDVVPAVALDTLDAELRSSLPSQPLEREDPDDFIVWSDNAYGDRDGDGLPELPVSRIPDGKTAGLVHWALSAEPPPNRIRRGGLRNVNRPFAVGIFGGLQGMGDQLVSQPTEATELQADQIAGDSIYLMLHGADDDGTRFWGEDQGGLTIEAMTAGQVPECRGAIVFSGCCWGALAALPIARRARPDTQLRPRTADQSIALRFLLQGANAFVGCTGAHYSQRTSGPLVNGGPLHRLFWEHVVLGEPPAQALFNARWQYQEGIPYGRSGSASVAAEQKMFHAFTCLGLGW